MQEMRHQTDNAGDQLDSVESQKEITVCPKAGCGQLRRKQQARSSETFLKVPRRQNFKYERHVIHRNLTLVSLEAESGPENIPSLIEFGVGTASP